MTAASGGRGCLARSSSVLLLVAAPLGVAFCALLFPEPLLQKGIVALVGVLALGYLATRPGPAAVVLIGGFTVFEIAFSLLFKYGMPVSVVSVDS